MSDFLMSLPIAWVAALVVALVIAIVAVLFRALTGRFGVCSGNWKTTFTKGGSDNSEEITLRCFRPFFGPRFVWGDARWHSMNDHEVYRVVGLEKGNILVAAYLTKKPHSLESGVFFVEFDVDGTTASGITYGYRKGQLSIEATNYAWKRP